MEQALISLPPWPAKVIFLRGGTPKELEAFISNRFPGRTFEVPDKGVNGTTYLSEPLVLWTRKKHPPLSTLAHEALHVVVAVLQFIKLPLTVECDEAYTYTLGYLLEQWQKAKWTKV